MTTMGITRAFAETPLTRLSRSVFRIVGLPFRCLYAEIIK
jgi:hypothetical protein